MAIRPDYDVGELTLTSGSSDFTTSGSALQTAAVQAGDAIITPSGHVLIIASITGQNSGTLFLPCPPDAAGTGLPLRIRLQPDGSRYQGAVRNLIDLLSSGNVEALAGLTGAAGKVPVFTGPGAMDLQDYIADPNGSLDKLAALTLAARQILQTDAAGDLKQVALEANKFLRTDANGDLALSDLGAAAIALLNLSGAPSANQMPYFNGVDGAALTPLTQVGRNLLGATTTAGQRTTVGLARPAFKATTSTNVGVGNGTQVVPFNTVSLNVGNGWSGTIFTAPESGVYAFSVDFNITGGTDNAGNTILSLYKDGGWWQETVRARRSDYFHSIDIATIAYLVAGQTFQPKLALEFWAGTVYAASGRCTISGALIG